MAVARIALFFLLHKGAFDYQLFFSVSFCKGRGIQGYPGARKGGGGMRGGSSEASCHSQGIR